ncbi:hypothetical protein [Luteolibacter soli]|uniref:Uncharacterized protein n=1 Tax=Luteolibacter soli TaxID=3135280 RepID=A0ABU9B2W9_9BACT
MNAEHHSESSKHRPSPAECEPGDWVEAREVPEWAIEEDVHTYVLPGQVMVQPMQQMPVAVPLMSWSFRPEKMGENVVWVRQ